MMLPMTSKGPGNTKTGWLFNQTLPLIDYTRAARNAALRVFNQREPDF